MLCQIWCCVRVCRSRTFPHCTVVSNCSAGLHGICHPHSALRSKLVVSSGVRGGGGRPPRPEKFRANSVFSASSSCSKILKDKKYFNTVKNFRANSVFQGKHKLLKNPECKNYIQCSENFQGKLCFSGQA